MKITKAVMELRGKLIESINASGLPPVVVGLVLDELRTQIEELTQEAYRKETEDGRTEQEPDAAE